MVMIVMSDNCILQISTEFDAVETAVTNLTCKPSTV